MKSHHSNNYYQYNKYRYANIKLSFSICFIVQFYGVYYFTILEGQKSSSSHFICIKTIFDVTRMIFQYTIVFIKLQIKYNL